MKTNVEKYDRSNMFDIFKKFSCLIEESFNRIEKNIKINNNFKNIVFCGMGGSSIGSAFVKNIIENQVKVPMFINNDYLLPNWVDESSLLIIVSYSGNTEETVSNFNEGLKNNSSICIISSGGYLLKQAKENNLSYCVLPSGYPPRTAFGFMSSLLMLVLNKINIVDNSLIDILQNIPIKINQYKNNYINDENNKAFKFAENLFEKNLIIYTSPLTKSVGYRFKCQLSENSKVLSYYHYLPELNHNDIEGYLNLKYNYDDYSIIWLYDMNDDKRIIDSIKRTSKALSFIESQDILCFDDKHFIERQYHMLYFLDIVTFYLSFLYQNDPTPIEIINKIKL